MKYMGNSMVPNAPFPRSPLRIWVHFILFPKTEKKQPRDYFHALVVCMMAARIHGTDKAVRRAAWGMLQNCTRTPVYDSEALPDQNGEQKVYVETAVVMEAVVIHPRPLALIELILRETELSPPKKKVLKAPAKANAEVKKGPKPKAKKGPSMKTKGVPMTVQKNAHVPVESRKRA